MQNTKISGQPVICQLLSYIPKDLLQHAVDLHQSDRYYKTMTTFRQLVFIFYGVVSRINSLNSLCKSLLFLRNKLIYLGIKQLPAVSTLSDANQNRHSEVFGTIYHLLADHYKNYLNNSYLSMFVNGEIDPKKVKLFDSTTIRFFLELYTAAGPARLDGKRKGGLKAHTVMSLDRYAPELVWMSPSSASDNRFLGQLQLLPGYTYVFDKGYHNYTLFKQWTDKGIFFVTRIRETAQYKVIESRHIDFYDFMGGGVICEQVVSLYKGHKEGFMEARLITYKDPVSGKLLRFLTNHFEYQAQTIVALYKNRWLMETFFKQLKQSFELSTFYSDSKQGVKTQIWICFIAQLIYTVIHKQVKECEFFATLVSMSAANLGSYQCFVTIIRTGRLNAEQRSIDLIQLSLFDIQRRGLFENAKNSP
jgi:hypothetical protein